MIRPFLCFPFLNIVSELCVTNALSAFPPRGTTLTIFNILLNSKNLMASVLSLFLCEGGSFPHFVRDYANFLLQGRAVTLLCVD